MQRLFRRRTRSFAHRVAPMIVAAGVCAVCSAWAADDDALALQSDEATDKPAADKPLRAALEAGLGRISLRNPDDRRDGRRLSLDLRYSARLSETLQLRLSDRIDHVVPAADSNETVNTLREASLTWQAAGANNLVEVGRVNLRQGPALGYNPTDYFRTGGLRAITTADPVALRELRQGTFMLRYSRLWDGGSASLALAPRLADAGPAGGWSVDAGATNNTHRALLTVSAKANDKLSGQATVLFERGESPRLGASLSALASDSVVAFAEWSTGRMSSVLDQFQPVLPAAKRRHQASVGLTFSLPDALSITLEAEHNGAGLDRAGWNTLFAQGPAAYQVYLLGSQRDQELAGRSAWLLYAAKTGLAGLKQLEFKGFVRTSLSDHSRLVWAEVRYHWPRFDTALQWQHASGSSRSEFGAMPFRQVVQLLGTYYW